MLCSGTLYMYSGGGTEIQLWWWSRCFALQIPHQIVVFFFSSDGLLLTDWLPHNSFTQPLQSMMDGHLSYSSSSHGMHLLLLCTQYSQLTAATYIVIWDDKRENDKRQGGNFIVHNSFVIPWLACSCEYCNLYILCIMRLSAPWRHIRQCPWNFWTCNWGNLPLCFAVAHSTVEEALWDPWCFAVVHQLQSTVEGTLRCNYGGDPEPAWLKHPFPVVCMYSYCRKVGGILLF